MSQPPAQVPDRVADALSLVVVAAVAVAHGVFIARDSRLPEDLGQYYKAVPTVFRAFDDGNLWDVLAGLLPTSGGWYQALLAAGLRVLGRSAEGFRAFDLAWVTAGLALAWRCGRRLGGPRGGLATVALLGAVPLFVVQGRTGWIHIPEVTLVLATTLAWLRNPRLVGWIGPLTLGLAGFLALTLRPSGLVWMGTLGLVALPPLLVRRTAWRGLAVVGIAWIAGALLMADELPGYLAAKLEARDRYAAQVPSLLSQISTGIGLVPAAVGGLAAAWGLVRLPRPVALVLGGQVLAAIALVAGSSAGVDNFPVAVAAVALAAGRGLVAVGEAPWSTARLRNLVTVLPWLPLPLFLFWHLPQWTSGIPAFPLNDLFVRAGLPVYPSPGTAFVAWDGPADREILALLDASCPDRTLRCEVLVDQGLFRPFAEDPGALQLFLAGWDDVKVWEARMPAKALQVAEPDAALEFECGDRDLPWRTRYPQSVENLVSILRSQGLRPAWSGPFNDTCTLVWLTPGGTLPDPSRAPVGWGAPGAPARARRAPP